MRGQPVENVGRDGSLSEEVGDDDDDRDNDDDINAVQFINEDTDEVLATVSNKRLEKAVDVRVNLIGVDKLRVKAGRISDDNNFEFGYNGGYLYNLYLTPITQK